jgi:hypothetical protein
MTLAKAGSFLPPRQRWSKPHEIEEARGLAEPFPAFGLPPIA